jgi:selenium metabolism protein YedF
MTRELDCRGLACPAPVMQVRDILAQEKPPAVAVIIDNEPARENVSRFLAHQGFQVATQQMGSDFRVTGIAGEGACPIMSEAEISAVAGDTPKKILVMVGSDRLGRGDDTLGAGLLLNFLKTLKEMGPELWRLIFVNGGVKLTASGAEAVSVLRELAETGVSILACGTCLDHFQLLDQKEVGETTNMLDIVTSLQVADKIINL